MTSPTMSPITPIASATATVRCTDQRARSCRVAEERLDDRVFASSAETSSHDRIGKTSPQRGHAARRSMGISGTVNDVLHEGHDKRTMRHQGERAAGRDQKSEAKAVCVL